MLVCPSSPKTPSVGKRSERAARKAIALEPDYASAHFNLGNALHALGKLTEAEVAYRKAIALKPDASPYNNLAVPSATVEDETSSLNRGKRFPI